jgi:aryl-alcohol dehydrogenase-like predicted oxidoreductase
VTLQPQYNLLARGLEWELAPVCQLEGVGMLAWSDEITRARRQAIGLP